MSKKLILSIGYGELEDGDKIEPMQIKDSDGESVTSFKHMLFDLEEAERMKVIIDNFLKTAKESDGGDI